MRRESLDSGRFYAHAANFADEVLATIEKRAGALLDGYCVYLKDVVREAPRSRGEYGIELLTLGMAVTTWEAAAKATLPWSVAFAQSLIWVRHHVRPLKQFADWLRALCTHYFLMPSNEPARGAAAGPPGAVDGRKVETSPSARLTRLIRWMRAAAEFEQEAIRLQSWSHYLATLTPDGARQSIDTAVRVFDEFALSAASRLGKYTEGVSRFLSGEYAQRGCREDQIFCGRDPAAYHLNMVAAEVMNRALRNTFERTTRKVVLVPACMRGAKAASCKAHVDGVDMTCRACDPNCAVNHITRRMRSLGVQVFLVPHTSGFSRWLDRWEREPNVGVIPVACMLNILPGGFEMRRRRIASQCVPLDYPGCRKHWDRHGNPTGVNEDRLVQIVAGSRRCR